MSLFTLIHLIFKFLLEFFKTDSRNKKLPNENGDRGLLFKFFILLTAFSFVLNFHLMNIGLQTAKRLSDYKASVDNKKIVIKNLESCLLDLEVQKRINKSLAGR